MTTALLSPVARQRVFTNLGAVAPGAKLYAYVAGSTTTPLATYSDADLGTENTQPQLASASGLFGPIYLAPGKSYLFELRDTLGNVIWQQDDVTTGGTTGSTYDITAFGATQGGSVDCKTAIQAAIDAAEASSVGGTVFFPAGTWRSSGQILSETSRVSFAGTGPGSIIVFDDVAINAGLKIATPTGATVVSSILAANTAIGDRTITLTAGGGATMAAGGWLYVVDSFADHGSFITYIESILGDVLTLQDAVPCVLTTAQTATAYYRPAGALQGVGVRDLRVTCVSAAPTNLNSLIEIANAHAPVVQNVQTSGCRVAGIWFLQCDDGLIQGCQVENQITTNGEGVLLNDSTNCKIIATNARHVQFGFAGTKSPKSSVVGCQVHGRNANVALGRAIKFQCGSNFTTITGNTIADPNLFGIYCQDSAWCVISSNTLLSMGDAVTTSEHGICVGGFQDDLCHHCAITGNVITGASGFGIAILPTLLTVGKDIFCTITGNIISGCVEGGILVFATNRVLISGNMVTQNPATVTQGGAIAVGSSTSARNVITGNAVFSTGSALVGIITSAGDGTQIVTDNALGPAVTVATALGDLIFGPSPTLAATSFETAGRFGTTLAAGGGNTFGTGGCVAATSATINSLAGVTMLLSPSGQSLFTGSPRFSAQMTLTLKGTDGQIMVSLGGFTATGTVLTRTEKHAGFVITWAASGAASLFATQGDGTTETLSSALTTVAQGDILDLLVQVNGAAGVEYRWSKNGGVWSPTLLLTTNVPSGAGALVSYLQASICNSNVASASTATLTSLAFSR